MNKRIRLYLEPVPCVDGNLSASAALRAEAKVLTLVHAVVPALRTMAMFQTEAGLVVDGGQIAVEVTLAPANQLPLLTEIAPARRMSERKLNLSALAELRSVQASIIETQRSVDELAAKLRNLRSDVLQSLKRDELALLKLVHRARSRQMKFTLPAYQETLCFPSLGDQVIHRDVVRLRVQLKKIGDEEVFAKCVEIREVGGALTALPMGTGGEFRLRPQANRFSKTERKQLADAYGNESGVDLDACLIRSTNGLQVIGGVVKQVAPGD